MAPWAWDLLLAGLRSLLVVGGSLAVGMATVPRRTPLATRVAQAQPDSPAQQPTPMIPKGKITTVGGQKSTPLPTPPPTFVSPPRANVVPLSAPRRLPEGMVSDFASRRLSKSPGNEADVKSVYDAYQTWCTTNNKQAMPPEQFIPSFVAYCDSTGVHMRDTGKAVYCVDVKLWA